MTNFVAAGFHLKKQETDSRFISRTTPDILARRVQILCLGYRMSYLTSFIYQLSVEVSLVTMLPKRTIESFFRLQQSQPVNILKMKLQRTKLGVWGGRNCSGRNWGVGGADKKGMSNFILSPPAPTSTFSFTPSPLKLNNQTQAGK